MISQVWKLLVSNIQKNWVVIPLLHSCCFFFKHCFLFWNELIRSCKNGTSFHKPFSQLPPIKAFITRVHCQNQETDIGTILWILVEKTLFGFLPVFTWIVGYVYFICTCMYTTYKILSYVDLCNHLYNENAELSHHHKGTPLFYLALVTPFPNPQP